MAQEDLARRGEFHAARMAVKKRNAEVFLEFVDLPTERRLGNVQFLRGLANRSEPCNRGEITQWLVDHFLDTLLPLA